MAGNSLEQTLQEHLADIFLVYMKVYKYHWNLKGEDFITVHRFYNEIFDYLSDMIDQTAERMRMLKMYAPCSALEYCTLSKIVEAKGFTQDVEATIADVSSDLATLISNLGSLYKLLDDASVSLFTNHELQLSKFAWFLESSLT